jgi:hypothetical protein
MRKFLECPVIYKIGHFFMYYFRTPTRTADNYCLRRAVNPIFFIFAGLAKFKTSNI